MRVLLFLQVALAMAVLMPGASLSGEETAGQPPSDSAAVAKSVTVFPIVLNSGAPTPGVPADMSKTMAELVGLMLERGGMKEIEIADAKFTPPENADLAKAAEAFGQFVRSQKLETEYALLGQFFGTPGKGVDEIRLVVVDRHGKVVLTNHLDKQQLTMRRLFSGGENACPMLACYYAVSELRGFWGLADSERKDAPEGKMARLWAEKSGLPPKAEQQAMQPRLETLKRSLKTSTVAVFVRGAGKSDAKVAAALAKMLTHEGLGRAEAATAELKFAVKPSTNQTRIAWDTARAFRDFLRKNPSTADYTLLADYGIGRTHDGKSVVGGLQIILCDRNGDWVLLTLRNSDHADFRRINPQSADDCNRLAVEAISSELR